MKIGKYLLNQVLKWLFGLIKKQPAKYPDELKEATRQAFIDQIKKK